MNCTKFDESVSSDQIIKIKNKHNHVIRSHAENEKRIGYVNRMLKKKEEIIEDLKMKSEELERNYEIASKLNEDVRSLFHKLCFEGADFEKEPNIDVKKLTEMFSAPRANISTNMDSIAAKVVRTDEYFRNCSCNEDFIERCKHLCNTYNNLKRLSRETSLRKANLIENSVMYNHHENENDKYANHGFDDYVKRVEKFKTLDRQRQNLINKIEKKKSDRVSVLEEYNKKRNETATPINIDLSMFEYGDDTNSVSNYTGQTETMLSPIYTK